MAWPHSHSRLSALAATVFAALAFFSCGERSVYDAAVYRFVDASTEEAADRRGVDASSESLRRARLEVPRASIGDDSRYVLGMVKDYPLENGSRELLQVPKNGVLNVAFSPPPQLRQEGALCVRPIALIGGYEKTELTAGVLKADPDGKIRLQIKSTPGLLMKIVALGRKASGAARIEKGPYLVPKDAVLEFGYGVDPAAWQPAAPPLMFKISVVPEGSGRDPALLFERQLDPARNPADRKWFDERIVLTRFSGERVRFIFEARSMWRGEVLFYPLWSNPAIFTTKPRPDDAMNFILISLDTLRADELSTYGYPLQTSPFLDELSRKEAIVFEKVFTTNSTTMPAHMSMFTGLTPSVHGLTFGFPSLSRAIPSLPEILASAGYETGAVTEDCWVGAEFGFSRGMNSYAEKKGAGIFGCNGEIEWTFDHALEWLRFNAKKKFFLFVHTYEVHAPYEPPPLYQNSFNPYVYKGKTFTQGEAIPSHLKSRRDYDREILYTDDKLRRFFQSLEELGLRGSTVVFVTADHGEAFLEHGKLTHGHDLYNEVLHVPLIVWGPGIVRGPRRVKDPVSIVDYMPTMLELAGLDAPDSLQGVSLARILREEGAQVPSKRMLFSELWFSEQTNSPYPQPGAKPPLFAVVGDRYKYVLSGIPGRETEHLELYDLEEDPDERNNLAVKSPQLWPQGLREIRAYYERSKQKRKLLVSREPKRPGEGPVAVDRRRMEALRALGYIQ